MFKRIWNQVALYESIRNSGIRKFLNVFRIRFDNKPISSTDELIAFIQSRAAYVGQTSLYGYLKTRIGIRYPAMFEDKVFLSSINTAKWHIYSSCLSDLTVFSIAYSGNGRLNDHQMSRLAEYCFLESADQSLSQQGIEKLKQKALVQFSKRVNKTDWAQAAVAENAFVTSPEDLIKWAPIAEEHKKNDREIVTNSIRFRWRDVREQLRKRIDSETICTNWLQKK